MQKTFGEEKVEGQLYNKQKKGENEEKHQIQVLRKETVSTTNIFL